MDFYTIKEREGKKGVLEVYPDFKVSRSQDLMIRGTKFYAIWDAESGLWSQDEYAVQTLVDKEIAAYKSKDESKYLEIHKKFLGNWSSSAWLQFRNYMGHLSDNATQLDQKLTFSNTEVTKNDFVSKRLSYALAEGDISAWDELVGTLYHPEERAKIEWAIGSIVAGDSKTIQKFLVFYGRPGSGKGTILDIIEKLFKGYVSLFDAKALTSSNATFATDVFRDNPLVALQKDGDLSKIEDNTRFNSITSHEAITMNEKYKSSYEYQVLAMCMLASNKPVKITDAKSGIIRRLIDIHPANNLFTPRKHLALTSQVDFELGAIAWHCLQVYREMGKDFYHSYRPVEMMLQTDVFYNFIEAHYDVFSKQDGTTLKQAYDLFKEFCRETNLDHVMPQYKFREELRNYFHGFEDRAEVDGVRVRSWYSGFNADRFKVQVKDDMVFSLVMDETVSLLDERYGAYPAQYSNRAGNPIKKWTVTEEDRENGIQAVDTILADLNTKREHYVAVPEQEIVIDFDLEDDEGNKSIERNLEAASQWPSTYAEYSRSEHGIHLHYYYDGDVAELAREYEPGIEIKVYIGSSSLRRKLSKCNNVPVATLTVGQLPIREKKNVINLKKIATEKSLRLQIEKNLRKEIHPGTKSSVDFIHKILQDAYESELSYDVTNMRQVILAFAANSSHQAAAAIKTVQSMKFQSDDIIEAEQAEPKDDRIAFFDIEIFPNLFIICWKFLGGDIVKMINPTAQQVAEVMSLKLVGFYNRRYDNHIMYAASLGWGVKELYLLSKKIIDGVPGAGFREAYNVSYADTWELSSLKQSLKQFQIDLEITHKELGLPWDEPVPEELWSEVVDYCANDVTSTEVVWESRKEDYIARQILADLSGLPINSTTQTHAAKIVFGEDRHPQEQFIYTNLAETFPGYKYEMGKSTYKGEEVGEGGLNRSTPGMYTNVAVLDVASMHPTSIKQLNAFGEYTKKLVELLDARVAIKRKDYAGARQMLGGILEKYLTDESSSKALSYALKIIINIIYGLTSASFDNPFRDPRNIDNIVAKRGALFMIELMLEVQKRGFNVIHIKTDSIKIPDATQEIIDFIVEFGAKYGYEFEREAEYEKICLLNDAVFAAKYSDNVVINKEDAGKWTSTGAQLIHPYVFKTIFSKERIAFKDKCESKAVQTALYLDFTDLEQPMVDTKFKDLHFVGKVGNFCPIKPGKGGGLLLRQDRIDPKKFHAATGTKGYYWLEAEIVKEFKLDSSINTEYFDNLITKAKESIEQYGDYEWFIS